MFLGKGKAEQTEFGVAGPHGLAPAAFAGEIGLAGFEAVVIREQTAHGVLEQALFVGEIEIHQSLRTALVRMFFWISLVPP